jgi:hypothetical protein
VPCCETFCAFPWHISIKVFSCRGTFCAVLWHILCLPVAHKYKSLYVPWRGTFCAVLWHILCLPMSNKSFCAVLWHILCLPLWYMVLCSLRIASQELQVKNCKSKIASQELQVNNCIKSILNSLDIFFSRLNEWKKFQSCLSLHLIYQ